MRIKLAIVVALLALGVAGCSDNGGEGVASAGGSPSSPTGSASSGGGDSEQDQLLAYSQCMRNNGVPNFQDPEIGDNGEFTLDLNGEGLDQATLQAAQDKCRHLLPNGGVPQTMDPERLEQLRRYAQCMRDNGVPSFPDPSSEGLQLNGNDPQLNPESPAYKRANAACKHYMPGGGGTGSLSTGGTA